MSKIKELQELSKEELEAKLIELKKDIMKQNAQIATGTSPKNPGKLRQSKKTVAQIIMLLNGKVTSPKKEETVAKEESKKPKEGSKKDG